MTKTTIFKAGTIALILLGLIHLSAHFGMTPPEDAQSLLDDMNAYTIELMGSHSLLKFHNGFSVMMGFLLSAFGLILYQLRAAILANKTTLLTVFLLSMIGFVISFIFFHVLAYGFFLFSTLCFSYTFFKK